MSDLWFTSDTHFCHNKSFLYEPRGFSSVEEMNEAIVERWNSVVPKGWGAIVYHLGDLCLSDTEAAIPYIQRLNGEIRWIRGNHCTDKRVERILEACKNIILVCPDKDYCWAYMLKDGKRRFFLSHYPSYVNNTNDKPVYCLCGHSHTQDRWADWEHGCYHVEMDAHDCYPISLDQIKAEIKAKKMEANI